MNSKYSKSYRDKTKNWTSCLPIFLFFFVRMYFFFISTIINVGWKWQHKEVERNKKWAQRTVRNFKFVITQVNKGYASTFSVHDNDN